MGRYQRARAAWAETARLQREQGGIRWRPEAVRGLREAGKPPPGKNKPAGPVEPGTRRADTNLKR